MSRPLRIVYVSWEFPPAYGGGIGTYVATISRILAARGHEVAVVTTGSQRCPTREIIEGVLVIRLPGCDPSGSGPIELLRAWQARADAVSDLLQRLFRGGVDLIEFGDYRGEGVTFLSSVPADKRPVCVVRLHTPTSVLNRYNPSRTRHALLEEYEHQGIRLADRLVSPSRALANEMRRLLPDLGPIDIDPYPADPAFLNATGSDPSPTRERATPARRTDELASASGPDSSNRADGCRTATGFALYVGRFEERKGVETLIRAVPAFLAACPGSRLVMIGGDTEKGPGQPSMRQVVAGAVPRELTDRVETIDTLPRAALGEKYRAARVCVFPSHFENFPNTCLEAMALGKIVIGTDNSGMAEIIEDGVSGVIVPAADADALASALIRVFRMSDAQATEMGRAARQRIIRHYHPDVVAVAVESLYARYALETGRPGPPSLADAARPGTQAATSVAVVIPCYNHGKYLADSLASVRAQTHPRVECVIVDDGSTEPATLAALDRLREDGVRVIRQDNQGLAAARNAGIRATVAPFYVPLDADDRIEPHFIEKLLATLVADPTLGYAYSCVRFFGDHSGGWECPAYDPRHLLIENQSVATAVVRRRAYDEAGGYSTDMIYGFEDWDLWIAMLGAGWTGRLVSEPLFLYRKHASGSMLDTTQKHRGEMVQKMIEHHRPLFAALLEDSLEGKDRLFFQAHTDAARLRERLFRQGGATHSDRPRAEDDELFQKLLVEAELNHIENSRLWRVMQRLRLAPAKTPEEADSLRKLERIKASPAYRAIQALKRLPMYQWYGRRRYGPDFGRLRR